MTGAGHGNTFQDNHGNYWNTGTPWLAVNLNFERRIAMFPAGFDHEADVRQHALRRLSALSAAKKWAQDEWFTGWMLLSDRNTAWLPPC